MNFMRPRTNDRSRSQWISLVLSPILMAATLAHGQEQDAEALAKAAQNPIASMISLPLQNNTNTNFGPQEKTQNVLNIQPVWPFSAGDSWNFITRTIVPVISQPALTPNGSRTQGLGDITFSGFLSPKVAGQWIWGVGGIALLPTGDKALTADKWGLGPAAVALTFKGPWVYGGLINNVWSVSGSGPNDVNLMTLQPFLNYNLPGARYFTFSPLMTANWEADSGEQWTVPVGLGYGKILKLGKLPVNGQISLYHNVVKPTFGPDWQLRVQLQFMFPK
jgi:hypothetical protein